MNFQVHITKSGLKDLKNISNYLMKNGDYSLDFITKLLRFTETIGIFPKKYSKKGEYYMTHFGKYNIFYLLEEENKKVKVFKIINSAQFSKYKKYFTKI